MNNIAGQVVGGEIGNVLIRQQSGSSLEIGDLLVAEEDDHIMILQVFGLQYGSQRDDRTLEMISGMDLEEGHNVEFFEPDFVDYVLARVKALAQVQKNKTVRMPKSIPSFFKKVRTINTDDLQFLQKENNRSIFVGYIRSGTKVLRNAEVWLDAQKIFSHHVLIPATTGRGKSNLVKTILYRLLDSRGVGALVLDAHNEYYGSGGDMGLKDHPESNRTLVYYTPNNPPPGALNLTFNLKAIRPDHFEGIVDLSEPQIRTMRRYYSMHKDSWISEIMLNDVLSEESKGRRGQDTKRTILVIQQKLRQALGIEVDHEQNQVISRHNVFDANRGTRTADTIVNHIESGHVVVLDTSKLNDKAELIVGSIVATRILDRYREAKELGTLKDKPVATIVIEEAPRVIGTDVLQSRTNNIYATIAREGRKFQVGLTAVTQMCSVIPSTILANMNTKIILGNELKTERQALIDSASQDLSADNHAIASLDRGEAIITSVFVPFALPVQIPYFNDIVIKKPPRTVSRIKVFK